MLKKWRGRSIGLDHPNFGIWAMVPARTWVTLLILLGSGWMDQWCIGHLENFREHFLTCKVLIFRTFEIF